jgi:hypothetical protein
MKPVYIAQIDMLTSLVAHLLAEKVGIIHTRLNRALLFMVPAPSRVFHNPTTMRNFSRPKVHKEGMEHHRVQRESA